MCRARGSCVQHTVPALQTALLALGGAACCRTSTVAPQPIKPLRLRTFSAPPTHPLPAHHHHTQHPPTTSTLPPPYHLCRTSCSSKATPTCTTSSTPASLTSGPAGSRAAPSAYAHTAGAPPRPRPACRRRAPRQGGNPCRPPAPEVRAIGRLPHAWQRWRSARHAARPPRHHQRLTGPRAPTRAGHASPPCAAGAAGGTGPRWTRRRGRTPNGQRPSSFPR